jgi:hypothetical protein
LHEGFGRAIVRKKHVGIHLAGGNIDFRLTNAVLYIGDGADLLECLFVLFMSKALPSLNSALGYCNLSADRASLLLGRICQLRCGGGGFVGSYGVTQAPSSDSLCPKTEILGGGDRIRGFRNGENTLPVVPFKVVDAREFDLNITNREPFRLLRYRGETSGVPP